MKSTLFRALATGFAVCAATALAGSVFGQQASITLQNCDAKYCYSHDNAWSLSKTVKSDATAEGVRTITWTISATKDTSAAPTFTVHGGLTILNSGSAPATIGNIVINLQKPNSPKKGSNASHVSIAANVADASQGDGATAAKVVAAASAENASTNAAWGINNYTVSGAVGSFVETAGSGSLEFTDANSNTVWAITPQQSIPVGQSVTLLYHATFNTAVMPPAGTPLRVETLVTFGNAGARGGSGATTSNVDINGSGSLNGDEAKVRTVPCRVSLPGLPANPDECNDTVLVGDLGVTTTGTVSSSNPVGFDSFPALIGATTSWDVSVQVDAGANGGSVCNAATLDGVACGGSLGIIIGYESELIEDPLSPGSYITVTTPIYARYECAAAAAASATSCVAVERSPDEGFQDGDYCTYTIGKYNSNSNNQVALYVQANFATLFPAGLTIGVDDGAGAGHHGKWTDVSKLRAWIAGGGPSGALTADTLNATTTSGGTLAKQTAGLTLNLALSGSGGGQPAGLGDLVLENVAGQPTVAQLLSDANDALGGLGLPGYASSYSALNALVDKVNRSFDDCTVNGALVDELGLATGN